MFNSRVWTDNDTQLLLKYTSSKKKIEDIARIQKRTVGNIETKLKSIAAKLYFNEQLPYDQVEALTGIKKDVLIIKRKSVNVAVAPLELEPVAPLESVAQLKPDLKPIQIISTECPFNLDTISTLIISSISQYLLTPS
uniref:Uncharacterized protein n=1 Tax=viral metagenome TaxID=1070528 RepID=A0A6C0ANI0_9ZZZZ